MVWKISQLKYIYNALISCFSVIKAENKRRMGGAAKERERGAGEEGTGEETERGDPCTGRIKRLMSTYILYQISKHFMLSATNQPLKFQAVCQSWFNIHTTFQKSLFHVYIVCVAKYCLHFLN